MKANIFFLITTVFWGFNYHWSKYLLEEVSEIEGAFWRYGLASMVLLALTFGNLPSIQTIRANFLGVLLIGGVGLFGFNFFFFKGMNLTNPLNAALIIALNPALTTFFSFLILRTSISIRQVMGLIIASVGVLFLLFKGDVALILELQIQKGDMWIMVASCFFAFHHVMVKKYSERIPNLQLCVLSALTCLACILMVSFFTTPLVLSFSHGSTFWKSAIGIGCFGTGIAYLLWYQGIQLTNATKASVFINVVPLSSALAAIVLGGSLEHYHLTSGLIIVGGILVMQWNNKSVSRTMKVLAYRSKKTINPN